MPQNDIDYITVQNFGTIQKVYKLNPYFLSSPNPKFTYIHAETL